MRHLKTYKLLTESADSVIISRTKKLDFEDDDAYAFSTDLKTDKIILANISGISHFQLYKDTGAFSELAYDIGQEDEFDPIDIETTYGRLWLKEKVISFWQLTKDLSIIIRELNQQLSVKIDKTWRIEDGLRLIPIGDFDNVGEYGEPRKITLDRDSYNLHLLKAKDKNKALMDSGYRGKQSDWKKHMKPFESFKYL